MEEDKEILYLLDIAINSYIENDILRLDVSDTTKNRLKRDLRKKFRDEDFIYDIRNNIGLIPKSKVKEKLEEIQKEYEETLKTANFKEIEKMNKINFRGITLEGQRSILRELLEKRK